MYWWVHIVPPSPLVADLFPVLWIKRLYAVSFLMKFKSITTVHSKMVILTSVIVYFIVLLCCLLLWSYFYSILFCVLFFMFALSSSRFVIMSLKEDVADCLTNYLVISSSCGCSCSFPFPLSIGGRLWPLIAALPELLHYFFLLNINDYFEQMVVEIKRTSRK